MPHSWVCSTGARSSGAPVARPDSRRDLAIPWRSSVLGLEHRVQVGDALFGERALPDPTGGHELQGLEGTELAVRGAEADPELLRDGRGSDGSQLSDQQEHFALPVGDPGWKGCAVR